jgi:hypothetical protein
MKSLSLIFASLSLSVASFTFASFAKSEAPIALKAIQNYEGETNGDHIVKFKSVAARQAWAEKLGLSDERSWESINGFSGTYPTHDLNPRRMISSLPQLPSTRARSWT